MQCSQTTEKIGPALVKAQEAFRAVSKSGENKFDKYRYADLEDYVRVVQPVLSLHKLAVVSSVEEIVAMDDRTTKSGGCEHVARVKVAVRIMHERGEWVETTTWGEGQDRADKAVYKAITGARKYGLACTFGLATSDDPESDEGVGQPNQNQPKQGGMSDGDKFIARVTEVMDSVGYDNSDQEIIVKAVLQKAKVKTLATLPENRRQELLDKIGRREFDKLLESRAVVAGK